MNRQIQDDLKRIASQQSCTRIKGLLFWRPNRLFCLIQGLHSSEVTRLEIVYGLPFRLRYMSLYRFLPENSPLPASGLWASK